jgi:alanine-glyoxylate transaminase / serine-glyoxylate transaminase / serine-pyruvate transaminase
MLQTYHAGRHFPQILGPTNVPHRVPRAIDQRTMDHRRPAFGRLGLELLGKLRAVFKIGARQ